MRVINARTTTVTVLALLVISLTMVTSPKAQLFSNRVINTEIKTGAIGSTQSYTDQTAWYLILVNKWNYIPDDYEIELIKLSNGQLVDKRVYPALQKMFTAARSAGVYPRVVSGYRTAQEQQRLWDQKVAELRAEGYSFGEAMNKAQTLVAVPGTSEHQLGISVDINADGINSTEDKVYKWLDKNAHKYGFIQRYPKDKTAVTGYIYEPWHYRYVGKEAAKRIYEQGLTFEEYMAVLGAES